MAVKKYKDFTELKPNDSVFVFDKTDLKTYELKIRRVEKTNNGYYTYFNYLYQDSNDLTTLKEMFGQQVENFRSTFFSGNNSITRYMFMSHEVTHNNCHNVLWISDKKLFDIKVRSFVETKMQNCMK